MVVWILHINVLFLIDNPNYIQVNEAKSYSWGMLVIGDTSNSQLNQLKQKLMAKLPRFNQHIYMLDAPTRKIQIGIKASIWVLIRPMHISISL